MREFFSFRRIELTGDFFFFLLYVPCSCHGNHVHLLILIPRFEARFVFLSAQSQNNKIHKTNPFLFSLYRFIHIHLDPDGLRTFNTHFWHNFALPQAETL